jgi:hypothetical protein
MFVRVKLVKSGGRTYRYLQLVENRRDGDRVRQRVVGSLGQLDQLQESGDLERVVRQLVEQCPALRIMQAEAQGDLEVQEDKAWGPVLVFDRVWEELGLKALLPRLASRQKLTFDFERMVFAQVLQRLVAPGSDLAGSKWVQTMHEPTFPKLRLQHFYRSLGLLWQQKVKIEDALFQRGLNLFNSELDLVFFDTTSTYFEGTDLEGWAKLGKSKDHRPDHLQLVLSVVMRRDGFPVCCEIWPGNTSDMKTLQPTVEALRKRFRIRKVVFVCDRGMASEENLAAMTAAGYEYIVGVKMRRLTEVRDEVLGRAGRYQDVNENLQVKEVWVEDRRYVICFNPDEAKKDAADREQLVAKLRDKLKGGNAKTLLNNRGYRRFVQVADNSASVDEAEVQADARYDGKYVLRTTTALPADEVAQAYKQLSAIERLWRELKDVVEVRPVFHHLKRDNVKGHIFVCFLALYVAAHLKHKLLEAGLKLPWDDVVRDLCQIRAVTIRVQQDRFLMRSPFKGAAGKVLAAVGIKPPALAEAL